MSSAITTAHMVEGLIGIAGLSLIQIQRPRDGYRASARRRRRREARLLRGLR